MAVHAVINLGNSIIGVSILAIPFCFKECGLLLGGLLLLVGSGLNKQSCHLLLRASKATRRNSYELLAYHTLGGFGKLAVELSIICLLMSCCVAYFIIMGDLGPAIVSKWFGLENDGRLRAGFLIFLATFFILPLSQRRNLESISSISVVSIVFYMLFTADLIFDCLPTLLAGDWMDAVSYWKPSGVFRGVSIFSAAFSCQTVLFAVYETLQERTVKLMEDVVNRAITFVCSVYMTVGFFGYVLYNGGEGPKGDILLNFQPSFMSEVLRLGFAISVALSFPLVVFPCRSSIYTLFFSSSHSLENPHGGGTGGSEYIPPGKFRFITFLIVLSTLALGITIPNVEVILGFTGATMGNLICFVFPSLIFLKVSGLPGRNIAKLLLVIGVFLMTASTYDNIQKAMGGSSGVQPHPDNQVDLHENQLEEDMALLEARKANGNNKLGIQKEIGLIEKNVEESRKMINALDDQPIREKDSKEKEEPHVIGKERHEPAIPDSPEEVKVKSGGKDADIVVEREKEAQEREKNSREGKEDDLNMKEGAREREEDENNRRKENLKEDADVVVGDVVQVEKRQNDILMEEKEKVKNKEDQPKLDVDEKIDEKRHKKEVKEIQKQSKKIKELQEMQQKQAEVIENQANALEFLLQKQKEDELQEAVQQQQVVAGEQQPVIQQQQPVLQQQPGVIQPQQGIVQAQQQPVIQPQQQAIVQQQQQPILQQGVVQAQQPIMQQQQQQVIQQQPMVQQQQQPIVQQQQPMVQQQQQPMMQQQQQPMIQQPIVQQQQPIVQQQQPMIQQQQQQMVQQQQQQPVIPIQQQQPMLQQQAVIQQQPVLQQQQQGFDNQQPVYQQAGVPVQQQQLPVVDQGGVLLQQVGGFQQGVGLQPGAQQADMVGQNVAVQNAQQQLWQDPQQMQQQLVQQQQLVGAGLQNLAAAQAAAQQQPVQIQEQQFVQQQQPLVQDVAQPAANEVKLEVKRDVAIQANNYAVDQGGLQGLPKELNIANRDIQGFAGNKRVLQSHGYEGDEEEEDEGQDGDAEEAKVGAGEGEEDQEGEAEQKQEEENLKKVDANKDPVDEDEDNVSTAGEGKSEDVSNVSPDNEKVKETEKKEVEVEKKNKFSRDILAVDEKNTTKNTKTNSKE